MLLLLLYFLRKKKDKEFYCFWLCDLHLACENIRFSSLFSAGDVSFRPRETSPSTKSEEKRITVFAG